MKEKIDSNYISSKKWEDNRGYGTRLTLTPLFMVVFLPNLEINKFCNFIDTIAYALRNWEQNFMLCSTVIVPQ